jgi:hypothetical protein
MLLQCFCINLSVLPYKKHLALLPTWLKKLHNMDSKRVLQYLGNETKGKVGKESCSNTFVLTKFFLGEMSDFPGVASYTWKNNLAWLVKVSLRGELAIWINYSSSNVARKHNLH